MEQKVIRIDKVVCIDASNKPNDIIDSCWLKEGEEYTPICIKTNTIHNTQFFVLQEIQPDNPYYGGYNVKRFAVPERFIEQLEEENKFKLVETESV